MSSFTRLHFQTFRNLCDVSINPGRHFNIFYGKNGAGKTSLLEAIYYFGYGRSFRTNNFQSLIQEQNTKFCLYSESIKNDNKISVGVERHRDGQKNIRFNKDKIRSIAVISESLPIQLISTESYRFFHDGPNLRRQYMNWGLFHTNPAFFPAWQKFLRILKQRNAGIKSNLPIQELKLWDSEFIQLSETIHHQRKDYVEKLSVILKQEVYRLLPDFELKLRYRSGWTTDNPEEYALLLEKSLYKDRAIGYTSQGPQRADLQLVLNEQSAGETLSQGQQKLASCALYLAQGRLLRELTDKTPIYLVDDLPSELDPEKRIALTNALYDLDAQVFISGITEGELSEAIKNESAVVFHVEHGSLTQKT